MRTFVVDAFTDRAFSGNPAGVVLLDAPAEDGWMQHVAAELRHSETAFLTPAGAGRYALRWFTPLVEVDLCGHATLAAAHVLAAGRPDSFVFDTRSGELRATAHDDGTCTLYFPAKPTAPVDEPTGLRTALGVRPVHVEANGMDLLVEVADAATVAALRPDIAALREVECRGVIVTARAAAGADHDFVSRFFAPRVGVDEDPVTGSAHCALGPYWAARLGRSTLTGVQLSPRGGRVGVSVADADVELVGAAVTAFAGELLV